MSFTYDPEFAAYATELSRAGVPVELHLHPGVPHEVDSIAFDPDVARRAAALSRTASESSSPSDRDAVVA